MSFGLGSDLHFEGFISRAFGLHIRPSAGQWDHGQDVLPNPSCELFGRAPARNNDLMTFPQSQRPPDFSKAFARLDSFGLLNFHVMSSTTLISTCSNSSSSHHLSSSP